MSPAIVAVMLTFFLPFLVVMWNRQRVKGKVLCYFVRKDKSVLGKLCELRNDFIVFQDRAYDIYPDLVRVAKFPMGWPAMFQELVPTALYDEEDAIPLDWINLDNRMERAMDLKSALDENWIRKLVKEAASEGSGFKVNWKKVIPILMIVAGGIGLVVLLAQKGCGKAPAAANLDILKTIVGLIGMGV
jgi:hypothetical protein